MPMLTNTWYMAAWPGEVVYGRLLGRTIANRPLVLFRKEDGTPVAMGDRCPHRFAPLHMGRQVGDAIQCGYHGLEFGPDGRCSRNPHGGRSKPSAAVVPTFPIVERHGMLWIWVGPNEASEALIPEAFSFVGDQHRGHARGYIHVAANYLLLLDNLMDTSHGLYLHRGSLTTEEMRNDYRQTVKLENGVVSLLLQQFGVEPPAFWAAALPAETKSTDLHDSVKGYIPSNVVHAIAYSPAGCPPYSVGGASSHSAHMFTPETDTSSHYFYCNSRDYSVDSPEVQDRIEKTLYRIFATEDKPMIEAQQKMLGNSDLMHLNPVLLPTDKAAVLMRRHLADLIQRENAH
jgi:phenylpropionate dioxygenase-like ring-hydroxylating dioxygenase large terminal subunit